MKTRFETPLDPGDIHVNSHDIVILEPVTPNTEATPENEDLLKLEVYKAARDLINLRQQQNTQAAKYDEMVRPQLRGMTKDEQDAFIAAQRKEYEEQHFEQPRRAIFELIHERAANGSTEVVLKTLDKHYKTAEQSQHVAAGSLDKHKSLFELATANEVAPNIEYHDTTLNIGLGHTAFSKTVHLAQSAELARRQFSVGHNARNTMAAAAEVRGKTDVEIDIETIFLEIHGKRERAHKEVGERIQIAQDILDNWPLDGHPDHPHEAIAREALAEATNILNGNELSKHDPLRAKLATSIHKTIHRIEDRGVRQNLINNEDDHDGIMTLDGGILLDRGLPTSRIFYEDGTVLLFDAAGVGTRFNTKGKKLDHKQKTPVNAIAGYTRPDFPGTAFDTWEQNRTPEATKKCYQEISGFVAHQSVLENQYVQTINSFEALLKSRGDQEAAIHRAESRGEPDDYIADLEAELRQIQDQINSERRSYNDARNDLPALRRELNPARYWQQFLEAETPGSPAQLADDSTVRVADFRMNGIRGTWRIRQDGMGILVKDSSSYDVYDTSGEKVGSGTA